MPVINGLEAASAIKNANPEARILIFTLYSDHLGTLLSECCVPAQPEGPSLVT